MAIVLWLGFDLCRTPASTANDALNLALVAVAVVARFVWRAARQKKRLESGIVLQARRVGLEESVERTDDVGFVQVVVAGFCAQKVSSRNPNKQRLPG